MTETHLQAGELLWVDRSASVQFVEPILIRLIRVLDQPTYDGWAWIELYQMDRSGDPIARRENLRAAARTESGIQRCHTSPALPPSSQGPVGPA